MNPIVLEELLASLGVMSESSAAAASGARATAAGLNDLEKATEATTKTTGEYNKKMQEGLKTIRDLYDEIKLLKEGAQKYGAIVNKFGDTAAAAYFSLNSLSEFIEGNFGEAGKKLVGGIAAAAGLFNKFAIDSLRQQDLLQKSYRSLSQFGAIDPTGLRGLLTSLEDIGTTPENAEFFIQAIGKASEQLVMFGGSVAEGTYGLTQIVKKQLEAGTEYEGQLNQLGYSTEDITKYTASYIASMSRNVKLNTTDTEHLRKSSFDYMTVLQELSELTGISRDAQEENVRQLQSDIQYRMILRKLGQEENGEEKVRRFEQYIQSFAGNKNLQRAIIEREATGGAIISQIGAMQMRMTDAIGDTTKRVINGTTTVVDGVAESHKKAGAEINKNLDMYRLAIAYGGKEAADALNLTADQIDFAAKAAGMDPQKAKDMIAAAKAQQDERIKIDTERTKLERQVATYYQELNYAVGNLAVPATKYLAEAALYAAKTLDLAYSNLPLLEDARKRAPLYSNRDIESVKQKINENERNAPDVSDVEARQSWEQSNQHLYEELERLTKQVGRGGDRDKFLAKEREDALQRARLEASKVEVERLRQEESRRQNQRDNSRTVDERLTKIIEEFKKLHPETRVTSTTGGEHMGKAHPAGRAMDIAFDKPLTIDEFEKYKKQLQSLGATNILNEMERPKGRAGEKWTGPHIHFEVPEKPAGPASNNVGLGIPNFNQNDTKLANNTPIITPSTQTQQNPDDKIIISKLDDLNSLFNKSLRVQEDILAHTKMLA